MKPAYSKSSSFLPDFCGVRMLFVVVLIGELLALVLTLAEGGSLQTSASSLALKSLFIQWTALSSVGILCLARRWLNELPDYQAATASYLLILSMTFLITELTWWILRTSPAGANVLTQSHGPFLLRCMGISAIVSALALRYFYVQHQRRRNIESEATARIEALQARIRPHFLFNCLNTIASLTRKEPRLAEEAIEDLSDLFRMGLKDIKSLSRLEDELSLCRRYLRIETHRLGERLKVVWNLDALPDNVMLPALTLQPLIENAIYHGIETQADGGTIRITGNKSGDQCKIIIDNPLPADGYHDHHEGNKLALDNIRQRITAFFGNDGKLETYIAEGRYHAVMTLPCQNENPDR
jgi:two-component system sensor histidine kinase AlgZ